MGLAMDSLWEWRERRTGILKGVVLCCLGRCEDGGVVVNLEADGIAD